MEFLIVFVPGALLVEAAWLVLYLRDRRLVGLLRRRHPDLLVELRGRERRWYDASEELWVQQVAVRRRLLELIGSRVAPDDDLATAAAQVRRGEWWFRSAMWVAAGYTGLLILALVIRYRLSPGG